MANGSVMALKLVLRGFGVNVDDVEKKISEGEKIVREFDMNELRAGLQVILDYRQDQAQNELRMKAIMEKLEIADPVAFDVFPTTEERNDGTDQF
jgi:uncharacterized protein YgfB (UPF0149 family)